MATKKDLVEAYSFSRRRLVTAFLSGAPGGREVEPSRPGRTVVGGLALAVLLVAGAAIASVLSARTPEDWNRVGLVVTRGDQPATYVILEEDDPPELIPVINITSAQLILGADVKATSVDQEVVDEQTPGIPIGILGAPQTLPRPRQFIQTGWTACTNDDVGIAVDVSDEERVTPTTSAAIVVHSAERYWLIATSSSREAREQRAYRYPIAESEGDNLLIDYGLGQKVEAIDVPAQWLALFPEGGEIGPGGFDLPHLGRKAVDAPVPDARVGDYVVDGDRAAMVIDGGWQPLDPFALAVLENSSFKHGPRLLEGVGLPASYAETTYTGAHWPDTALGPLNSAPCAQLDVAAGQAPRVWLAGSPTADAESPEAGAEGEIAAAQRTVSLDRGRGAFVQVGTWDETESDSTIVIDPLGKAYPLVGGPITLEKLGYDESTAPVVPDEWAGLFDEGVALSTSAALCPPANQPGQPQSSEDCRKPPT
ncbi:type VII secretion protein EccB [Nocardioides halotolerans]|uniref:type VII secretion protein EccB n=1 Tax=Nocardioides halotolerans TaxID=433660 RepID=UPI0003F988E2|nr:type VII secretion protein EccB [Nocardioides halotolerans]